MRVRCLVAEASQYWEYRPGAIYDVPDEVGRGLIAASKAELVITNCPHCGQDVTVEKLETATVGAAQETATLPRAARR